MIQVNPADAVDPPRVAKSEMQTLSSAEIKKLLTACEGSLYYIPTMLAVMMGMRRGEICALRWSDVDLDGRKIHISRSLEQTKAGLVFKSPKTAKSRRTISMPRVLVQALRQHKGRQAQIRLLAGDLYQSQDLVCARDDGSPIPPNTMSGNFYRLFRRAGIKKVRFHDLRHSHITLLIEQGVHAKMISERAGHANIGITMDTYGHVMPAMESLSADKMDELFGG